MPIKDYVQSEILNRKSTDVPIEDCGFYALTDCLIATEIYGTDAEETDILRAWRDTTLNTTPIGRLGVRAYYAISPKIVKLLKRYPILRRPVKSRLDHFVDNLRKR